jgi:four helix bundle protein
LTEGLSLQDFKKLFVWKKGHNLTLAIYKATKAFPTAELYGLTGQLRRASASIPANIAEGCGRSSKADLARFLQIAFGSASELEYHLLLARDLELLSVPKYQLLASDVIEIKRMLSAFIRKLKTDD